MRLSLTCKRPAVSTMTTSVFFAFAEDTASKITAAGIASLLVLDDSHLCPVRPHGELFPRRRAEGVRGRDRDRLSLFDEIMRQLSDSRRFSNAVYAYQHNDAWIRDVGNFRLFENIGQNSPQKFRNVCFVFELFSDCLRLHPRHDFFRRGNGNVRRNEEFLQFLIKFVAQFVFGKQNSQFFR